jgi:hypothetical protein
MKRLFVVFSVLIMLLSLIACAEMQPKTARQVYNEVNRINMELPRRKRVRGQIFEFDNLDIPCL